MDNNITFLYGHQTIILKPPVIRKEIIKRRFWFNKIQYYIDWEYCSMGPMSLEDAEYYLTIANV